MEARHNPQAEADFEVVFATVRAARSLAADYNLTSNIQGECAVPRMLSESAESLLISFAIAQLAFLPLVFLESKDDSSPEMLRSQSPTIQTLIKGCNSVSVVPASDIPAGCAVSSISTSVSAHVLVRGLVNIDAELGKLSKKLDLAINAVERAQAPTKKDEWKNAPEEVRTNTEERIKGLEAECEALRNAIRNFESIRDA